MKEKKKALGRGLGALLEDASSNNYQKEFDSVKPVSSENNHISLDLIQVNTFQPRTDFDETSLRELADSISEHGIIQPITVRKMGKNKFEIISGERRVRAAKLAGLYEIPAYIRTADDIESLEMAIVENIQRENLNALEISISYQRLIDECSLTQEELGRKVSKNRTTVTNYLRLLKLPAEIQIGIKENNISMGHARALINVEDAALQSSIFKQIIEKELSVRNTEEIIRNSEKAQAMVKKKPASANDIPAKFQVLRNNLSEHLGTKVEIVRNSKGKGNISIEFASDEQFSKIIQIINA